MLRAFWRGNQASTAVEFGMVAAPFLVLVFAALQIFLLSLVQQMLETAAEASGRSILTGNAQSLTQAQFKTLVCSKIPAILACSNVMVDVQVASSFSSATTTAPTLTYDSTGAVSNSWAYNPGAAGNIVVMRVMYRWPVFNLLYFSIATLTSTTRLVMATVVFKNESF